MIGLNPQIKNTDINAHQTRQTPIRTKKQSRFKNFIARAKPVLRTALSVCTLGLFDLACMAAKSYNTRKDKATPLVKQQQVLLKNLAILDSDIDLGETSLMYGVKEHVAANVRKKCSKIGGPNPFIYIAAALEEVRRGIYSEKKVLTSCRYAELLETSLTKIYINQHLQAEVQAMLRKKGLPYPNNAVSLLLGMHSKEYNLLVIETNPDKLKEKLEGLSLELYISAHNLHVQTGVIDECLLDGYRSILRSLDFTPQQTFSIPRLPIIASLESIAAKAEKALSSTGKGVLTTSQDYNIVQQKGAALFGSIIQTGILAKASLDGDAALTAKLLGKAVEVYTLVSRNKDIEKMSSPDTSEASKAARRMYYLYSDYTQKVFGPDLRNLTSRQKDIFLCMVTMLIKHQNEKIGSTSKKLLEDLEVSLSAEGLHETRLLANQNPNSPKNSRIRQKIAIISGSLKVVKTLIGGRGFGLE